MIAIAWSAASRLLWFAVDDGDLELDVGSLPAHGVNGAVRGSPAASPARVVGGAGPGLGR